MKFWNSAAEMSNFIHMGSLSKPHGISGEILLHWFGVSPFSRTLPLFLQTDAEEPWPVTIEQVRRHNGRLILRLAGVTTRDAAASLQGTKVLTLRSSLPAPSADEAYVNDLLGATVFGPDETPLGRFSHVLAGTAGAVWSIITDAGDEILFPAEPMFIRSLDVVHKRIIIDPPPGLLELYQR